MSGLRAVDNNGEPLSLTDLKSRGDQLLGDAKDAAQDAVVASMQREFFMKGRSYGLSDVQRLQAQAREAAQAWQKVDGLLSELLLEVQKSSRAVR